MFSYPGSRLDCMCVADRIFLAVKLDHVFVLLCNKAEELSQQGRVSTIEESQCAGKLPFIALNRRS